MLALNPQCHPFNLSSTNPDLIHDRWLRMWTECLESALQCCYHFEGNGKFKVRIDKLRESARVFHRINLDACEE